MIIYSAYIYGANFIAKFLWESGFLSGFHGIPLGHQREWKYFGHLSVMFVYILAEILYHYSLQNVKEKTM